uniref:Skp1-related protein n=1 Tax=Taenia asiatica TaxID=60517 RepID=A0A0R3VWN6_TAEAS
LLYSLQSGIFVFYRVVAEPAFVVLSAKMPVKLVTSDNVVFDVDLEVAIQSVMIRDILEDLITDGTKETNHPFPIVSLLSLLADVGPEAAEDDEPIPLQYVNADILRKVLQWCTHHKDNAPQADYKYAWDEEFLRVDQGTLIEILMAANYLDIEDLLDACCKTIANMIRGKKLKEIRKTFNIKSRRHR